MMTHIIRQGDILVVRVAALPPDVTRRPTSNGQVVLAYGEATGHAHTVRGDVVHYDAPNAAEAARQLLAAVGLHVELGEAAAASFLTVGTATEIEHPEHAPGPLVEGYHVVIRQREWSDANEPIQVTD